MLPLKLTLKGIYSYQDQQTIDFQSLTNAGLFGIFGGVGSGKSSILEAISFVLYNETERLNSKDKRSYNMLNLKSSKAFIDFEFENFQGNIFKFIVEWTRKKKFEDINQPSRRILQLIEEEWIPVENRNAASIIGLKYENFRRTIIIPQGKFQEFLELGGADRTKMIMDIFKLHRYDLQNNVSQLSEKNKSELDILSGEFKAYELLNGEDLENKKRQWSEFNIELENHRRKSETLEKEISIQTQLKEKYEALNIKQKEFETLKSEEEGFKNKKELIILFEKTEKAFSAILKTQHDFSIKLEKLIQERIFIGKERSDLMISLKQKEMKFEKIKIEFQQIDQWKLKLREYDFITEIINDKIDFLNINHRIEKGNQTVVSEKEKLSKTLVSIQKIEEYIDEVKKSRISTETLFELGEWYQKNNQVQKNLQSEGEKLKNLQREKLEKENVFINLHLKFDSWESDLKEQITSIQKEEFLLQKEEQQELVIKRLEEYTHNIEDGKPCPLCGSLEHPQMMKPEDVTENLRNIAKKREFLNAQKEKFNEIYRHAHENNTERILIGKQIDVCEYEIKQLKLQKLNLESLFIWTEFDKENETLFLSKKSEAAIIEKEITQLEEKLKSERKEFQLQSDNVNKYAEVIQKLKNQSIALNSKIEQKSNQVKILKLEDFLDLDSELIILKKESLSNQINSIQNEYDDLGRKINELKPVLSAKAAQEEGVANQIKDLESLIYKGKTEIDQLLRSGDFSDINEVQLILDLQLETEQEKISIEEFFKKLFSAEQQIAELKELLKNKQFDSSVFEEKIRELNQCRLFIEELIGKVNTIHSEILKIEKDLERKGILETKLRRLENRQVNLNTLYNLFKGSGFVNYVSGVYLGNLCKAANIRFHKLTKNQLSLSLNEKNEFEVIDYLNNGHSRSVKTLSGGQTFQASLSLALALAESAQVENKSKKNFFFIDEGFGTQDKEMIQIVFDTLQSLHKENRIVGVISHVEELQEQIPLSLMIRKDEEKGSIIHHSWQN